jgi:hypothetical protein
MPDLSNVLITYKVRINGVIATALLDTGAQKDFINKAFTNRHNIKTSYQYRMANGLRQDASHEVIDASINLKGFVTTCSPPVTASGQFDLILGMPWLTNVQPVIDFKTKDATVTLDNGDSFTTTADLKIPTAEEHIASLNAVEFARSARRGVDFFLGWLQPQETTTVALNNLNTEFEGRTSLTTETPSPWSRPDIPLTAEGLPVQPPTLETDAERDHRLTDALATLKFPGCASPKDKSMIQDTLESYRDVLRGMPSCYVPPHRPGVALKSQVQRASEARARDSARIKQLMRDKNELTTSQIAHGADELRAP